MNWYLVGFRKYAKFGGRSSRAEFWSFYLLNLLFFIGLIALDLATGIYAFSTLYFLATVVPLYAVGCRRLTTSACRAGSR